MSTPEEWEISIVVKAYLIDDLYEACQAYGLQADTAYALSIRVAQEVVDGWRGKADVEAWRLEVMKRVAEILGEPS